MVEEFQNANGVACGQREPLVPRHDLLRSRQCGAHHEGCKIQSLVCGGGEKALLFPRCAQFDPIIADSRTDWDNLPRRYHKTIA